MQFVERTQGAFDRARGRVGHRVPEGDQYGDSLIGVKHERRQGCPGLELITPTSTQHGRDGVAQIPQSADVTPHSAWRHLELFSKLIGVPVASPLKERQQFQ